jgi:uncharacterized protein
LLLLGVAAIPGAEIFGRDYLHHLLLSSTLGPSRDGAPRLPVGTLASGQIDPAALDPSELNEGRLRLRLDGGTPLNIDIPAATFTVTTPLTDVAERIEHDVRHTSPGKLAAAPARRFFHARAVDGRLELTSGSRTVDSQVEAIAPDDGATDIRPLLKLDPANPPEAGVPRSETGAQYLARVLGGGSTGPVSSRTAVLWGGRDGRPGDVTSYQRALASVAEHPDIRTVCLPGRPYDGADAPFVDAAIAHAETTTNRVVIVDPPRRASQAEVAALPVPRSTYAALYYPWLLLRNPFHDPELRPGAQELLELPPSGHVAGMWARIDGRRGVWKAPAGTETGLLGIAGFNRPISDTDQHLLNPQGVNALRVLPGYGKVIWGARTLATRSDPPWRYVPVRRTAIFIRESIRTSIRWAVFEPNDEPLWGALRASIGGFMDGLFRAGAFQGQTARQAYFVRCGLGPAGSMTQDDIDAGRVIVEVGFAPLKPAEFVIVRVEQKVADQ